MMEGMLEMIMVYSQLKIVDVYASFCCDNNPNCCALGQGVFLEPNGLIASTSASTLASSASAPTSTPVASSSPSFTSISTFTSAISSSTSPTLISSSPVSSPSETPQGGLSQSTTIGMGVAVPVVAILVFLL